MVIGDRLRAIREQKGLSQGDIEKRSGLKRPYISRIEHGYTVPSIQNLEKLARALDVPLYEILYEGEEPPKPLHLPKRQKGKEATWGSSAKNARLLSKFRRLFARMDEGDRWLLMYVARGMARHR